MGYVQQIVGRMKWKKLIRIQKISNFVTISDEALTLLAIDNSEFVWEAQALTQKTIPRAKYTSKRPNRRIHEGWSDDGKHMFNVYFDKVIEDRKNENRKEWEEIFHSEVLIHTSPMMSLTGHNLTAQTNVVVKDDLGFDNECLTAIQVGV